MTWETPITDGFAGLNSFFGQIAPYLVPILLILFIGVTFIVIGRRVVYAVS
jgi:hypothetical protein